MPFSNLYQESIIQPTEIHGTNRGSPFIMKLLPHTFLSVAIAPQLPTKALKQFLWKN